MRFQVIASDDVYLQLAELSFFLDEQRPGYGKLLMDEFDKALPLLRAFPASHRIIRRNWRLIELVCFKYVLVYRIRSDNVYIVKIVHVRSGNRKKFGPV